MGPQSFTLASSETRELVLEVCVPEGGHADVTIEVDGSSSVRAIPIAPPYSDRFREVGVQLSQIRTAATGRTCQT